MIILCHAIVMPNEPHAHSRSSSMIFLPSGKSSVGKSSLVNSILNEQVSRVMAFKLQADTEMTSPFTKQVGTPTLRTAFVTC